MAVETNFRTDAESVEVSMPNWTPGSYKIRDHAKHISRFLATDRRGRALRWMKIAKNRWRIETGGASRITFSYRLYAAELSVRTNYVDEEFALLNGAAVFMQVPGFDTRRHKVVVELPEQWLSVVSALPTASPRQKTRFFARSFDELVDSPLVAGNPDVYSFSVLGQIHRLVNVGDAGLWDNAAATRDLAALVKAQAAFWGGLPFKRGYTFFNLLVQKGGGLEHKASTVMMTDRWATQTREGYVKWLNLASHEYFHTWNVKRLRPRELGPFDYQREVYTKDLWVAEGFTRYYQGLMLLRAGLISEKEHLKALAKILESVEKRPGGLQQSLVDSSFDAWVKFYQSNENSRNSTVNYYSRGAVVAFLLDMQIRESSLNKLSLDDVMRAAYVKFSGEAGYSHDQLIGEVADLAGPDIAAWLDITVSQPGKLDYEPALDWLGLNLTKGKEKEVGAEDDAEPAYFGIDLKKTGENAIVSRVIDGFSARAAGINAGDEIVAINGYRVSREGFLKRMDTLRPDVGVELLISRRQKLLEKTIVTHAEPKKGWKLVRAEDANQSKVSNLEHWLAIPEAEQ